MTIPEVVQVAPAWLATVRKRVEAAEASRSKLEGAARLSDDQLRRMDSSLKKTTAVMKKLKVISKEGAPALLDDVNKINLSKFVDEMALAVAEAKLKLSDVPAVVEVCVALSCRYAAFSEELLTQLKKLLPARRSDKISNPAKLRVDLRLLGELLLHGIVGKEGLQALGASLAFLVAAEKTEHPNLGLIVSLAGALGWELAGIVPAPPDDELPANVERADIPQCSALTAEQRRTMHDLFVNYLKSVVKKMNELCDSVNKTKKLIRKMERTRGDATSEARDDFEHKRTDWMKVREQARELAGVLGEKVEEKEEEESDDDMEEGALITLSEDAAMGIWPDADSRSFYENLLDLRKIVPSVLYKDSDEAAQKAKASQAMVRSMEDVDVESMEGGDEGAGEEEAAEEGGEDSDDSDATIVDEEQEAARRSPSLEPSFKVPESTKEIKEYMDIFLSQLMRMSNRDKIDQAALDFVSNLNTPVNRRRLSRFVLGFNRLDVVPFLARLLATLECIMADFVQETATAFVHLLKEIGERKKDVQRLENKLACTSFVAELVKFGVIPRAEGLACLRVLVYFLAGHTLEMAALFLESAGFYLHRHADSHPKMKTILEVVLKKKARIKDPRYQAMLENAYFAVLPPESMRRGPVLPPLLLFIRHLICSINNNNVVANLRCLRRIDWTDTRTCDYAVACLSSPWLVTYANLPSLASLVGGLAELPFHDWISVSVVDNVLETIRLSLEIPHVLNQAALSSVVYLGELYNFCVCNAQIIFKTLYQLISFAESPLGWRDQSRIRLVCELVSTVGEFFRDSRRSTSNMMCFLAYFYRFYWMKREQWEANAGLNNFGEKESYPLTISGQVTELHNMMLKGRKEPRSLQQAEEAVRKVESTFKAKIESIVSELAASAQKEGGRRLHGIAELDENTSDGEDVDEEMLVEERNLFEEDDVKGVNRLGVDAQEDEEDDFLEQFERTVTETAKATVTPAAAPLIAAPVVAELAVPQATKERLLGPATLSGKGGSGGGPSSSSSTGAGAPLRVGLLTRGKGNRPELKHVDMNEARLEATWREEQARAAKEREHLKRLTLAHSERQARDEEETAAP